MSDETWKLPSNAEQLERAGERFRAATEALKALLAWLERKGENPPECVLARAAALGMTPEQYYAYYRDKRQQDWLDSSETEAIEDWAIHQVQPNWKRNPNPQYPKG